MSGNKASQFKESIIFLKKVLYSKESVILNEDFYFPRYGTPRKFHISKKVLFWTKIVLFCAITRHRQNIDVGKNLVEHNFLKKQAETDQE